MLKKGVCVWGGGGHSQHQDPGHHNRHYTNNNPTTVRGRERGLICLHVHINESILLQLCSLSYFLVWCAFYPSLTWMQALKTEVGKLLFIHFGWRHHPLFDRGDTDGTCYDPGTLGVSSSLSMPPPPLNDRNTPLRDCFALFLVSEANLAPLSRGAVFRQCVVG